MLRPAVGPRRDDREAVGRRRRDIDVGRRIVVQRDAEHLSDPLCAHRKRLRRADELGLGRTAHAPEIYDAQRRPFRVDEGPDVGILAGRDLERTNGAGEPGDRGIAGLVNAGRRLSGRQVAKRESQGHRHGDAPHRAGGGGKRVVWLHDAGPPHFGCCRVTQVPLFGSGMVVGGQHSPQEVICAGLQQLPSKAIPWLGSEHGVTQSPTPPRRVCPAGQAGGGHMPNGAKPKFAGWFVLSHRHNEIPFGIRAPGCV